MTKKRSAEVEFDDELEEQDVGEGLAPGSIAAVVSGTDWTTETIVSQLERGNIQLNPRFQRRDAWKRDRKSRFIESLIVGLPIPQIVLAESRSERGQFIVLDGKQRLLAILQFWGLAEGTNNSYALSGLTLRPDLKQKSFVELSTDPDLHADFNALSNQPVRTVVIRNWKDSSFLHTVFLRLNTGSVKLSPQELRQALLPGPYSNYLDDASASSKPLQKLLGLAGPDARMRDIEILARFLAFRFFADQYPGRMKQFLDSSFRSFNARWKSMKPKVQAAVGEFEEGVEGLISLFGQEGVARKPDSRQFNRAIFDALIYFHSQPSVRRLARSKTSSVKKAYTSLFTSDTGFLQAVESDTAGAPNTAVRLKLWAKALTGIAGKAITAPPIPTSATRRAKKKRTSKR